MDQANPIVGPVAAARILGVSDRTVARWADLGFLPVAFRTRGGARRFSMNALVALRDECRGSGPGRPPISSPAPAATPPRAVLLTPDQAGRLLGVPKDVVVRYVATSRLPSHGPDGGHLRVLRSEVEALLERMGSSENIVAQAADPGEPPVPPHGYKAVLYGRGWQRWAIVPLKTQSAAQLAAAAAKNERAMLRYKKYCAFLGERLGVTREQLYDLVWSVPLTQLAPRYRLTDNGLRKVCKRYRIPVPARGYWRNLGAREPTRTYRRPPLRRLRCLEPGGGSSKAPAIPTSAPKPAAAASQASTAINSTPERREAPAGGRGMRRDSRNWNRPPRWPRHRTKEQG